ncbi:hypothetical protein ACIBO2_45980 [Nonomuraea sp. NPDC050022]|uniref:hypothetical protein n=1 Tax=Nonomuraea sp. NPDC050022 TaxID=3364358 RepID=UPI0037B50322
MSEPWTVRLLRHGRQSASFKRFAALRYALLVAAWVVVACRSLRHAAAHAGRPERRA